MAAPVVLLAVSTAVTAYGAIYQAQAASAAARTNANIADQNAVVARQKAALDAARHRKSSAKFLAGIRTGFAASGVTLEGSPLDVLEESALNAELDNQLITYGGELQARGFQNEAALDRMRARSAQTAGVLGAAGALASGGSDYYDLTRTG